MNEAAKAADRNHMKELVPSLQETRAVKKPTWPLQPYRMVPHLRLTGVDGHSAHGDCYEPLRSDFIKSSEF